MNDNNISQLSRFPATLTELQTERLTLHLLLPDYFIHLFQHHGKAEIMRQLGFSTDAEYDRELFRYKGGYTSHNRSVAYFRITHRQSNAIVGACALHNWNAEHRRAELGYSITNEAYKQQGIMTETIAAVLAHGFGEMDLHRIEALVGRNNTASLRLVEKFGFIKEGMLREHYFNNNRFEDSVIFGKLQADYRKEKG